MPAKRSKKVIHAFKLIPLKKMLRGALWLLVIGLFLAVGTASALLFYYSRNLPKIGDFDETRTSQSTKIYDRTGKVMLFELYNEQRRTVIGYEKIPQNVKDATIAVEDASFWTHQGFDLRGIVRALVRDVTSRSISQGGSTITQQVIKNTFLTREQTLGRKIREAILAVELERNYSKEKILELYLNQIPYGSNAYGIEAASQIYFNKSAPDLTLSEAALLAALPQAPSYYSPRGSHQDELFGRQRYILDRMVVMGSISKDEAAAAKKETFDFEKINIPIHAPHFVLWIREMLEARYGTLNVEESGFRVITSLDWELQQKVETIVHDRALDNEKKYKAKNAAAVVIDPRQGEVLAMVGSRDYFDDTPGVDGNVNVSLRALQPGSAFKPIAYAAAFEKGYRDTSIVYDAQTNFGGGYTPRNYDGRFRGPVTLRTALAQSLNIPAVKTLYLAGTNETIDLAEDFGITTLKDRARFGLALVLGGAEVKLFELTRAYGVFATEGIFTPSRPILRIEDANGHVIEEARPASRRVLDREVARTISDILSDNEARTLTFGARSALVTPGLVTAVKTGTTQDNKSAWAVGYTPEAVVGVWAGNNDLEPMTRQGAGVAAAGPIWNAIIQALPRSNPIATFARPAPQAQILKPMVGGYLGEPGHDILFYTDKNHPEDSGYSMPSYEDPQFPRWEAGASQWAGVSDLPNAPPNAPASPSPSPLGTGGEDTAVLLPFVHP